VVHSYHELRDLAAAHNVRFLFEAAVKKAQDLGIAETDPSFDVDGWDAALKVSALATV
jgi:homoserine dehydrogenase